MKFSDGVAGAIGIAGLVLGIIGAIVKDQAIVVGVIFIAFFMVNKGLDISARRGQKVSRYAKAKEPSSE